MQLGKGKGKKKAAKVSETWGTFGGREFYWGLFNLIFSLLVSDGKKTKELHKLNHRILSSGQSEISI